MKSRVFIVILQCVLLNTNKAQTYFNNLYDLNSQTDAGWHVVAENDRYIVASTSRFIVGNFSIRKNTIQFVDLDGTLLDQLDYQLDIDWGYTTVTLNSTSDNGYLVGSSAINEVQEQDIVLLKVGNTGNQQWVKRFDTGANEVIADLIEIQNDSLVLVGTTGGFGNLNGSIYVVKTDSNGNLKWEKSFGNCCEHYRGQSIIQSNDNGFIVVGYRREDSSNYWRTYILKIDEHGNFEWDNWLNDEVVSQARSICKKGTNYFIGGVIAYSQQAIDEDNFQGFIYKMDDQGNFLWKENYGADKFQDVNALIVSSENEVIAVGTSTSANDKVIGWLINVDFNGNLTWQREFERNPNFSEYLYQMDSTIDGGYVLVGNSREEGQDSDVWLVKTDEFGCDTMGCEIYDSVIDLAPIPNLKVYPNPTASDVTIQFPAIALNTRIEVVDLIGKAHIRNEYSIIAREEMVSIKHLPKGVYIVRVVVDNTYQEIRKIIKQ